MNTFQVNPNNELPDIRIRMAVADDIEALTAMANLALMVLGAQYYSQQQIASCLQYLKPIDNQVIADGSYFVVQVAQQIVGGGGWSRRRALHPFQVEADDGNQSDLLDPAVDAARIRSFYVHPNWAGLGIARHLMRLCEQKARQAGFARLELLASLTSVPLYRRCGFVGSNVTVMRLPDATVIPMVKMKKRLSK